MQYKCEDNIDFMSLLKLSPNQDDSINNENNNCLITNTPLEPHHVTLSCGHKFNHLPLFLEIKQQKTRKNYNEIVHLKPCQIKCPYCRKIQNNLLPYHDGNIPGISRVHLVNSPENLCMLLNTCAYIFKSGKKKGQKCNKGCSLEHCKTHTLQLKKQEDKKSSSNEIKNKKIVPKPKPQNIVTDQDFIETKKSIIWNKMYYMPPGAINYSYMICCGTTNNNKPCSKKSRGKPGPFNNYIGPLLNFNNNGWTYQELGLIHPAFTQIINSDYKYMWFCFHHAKKINEYIQDLVKLTSAHAPPYLSDDSVKNSIYNKLNQIILFIGNN